MASLKPGKRMMNFRELSMLMKLFEQCIDVIDSETCAYRDDWSDEKVAEALRQQINNPDVVAHKDVVRSRRQQMYGVLANPPKREVATVASAHARIGALEERVKILEDLLTK